MKKRPPAPRPPRPAAEARRQAPDWAGLVVAACRRIEDAEPGMPIGELLAGPGASPAELRRQFRARLGTTPKAYLQALRLTRLVRRATQEPGALAATLAAGFESGSRGYAAARQALGVAPGGLRRELRMGWWLGLSELGWMLMAATPAGICWLSFGPAPQVLLDELATAFPRATWVADGSRLRAWFEQVRQHILLPEAALELPLDVRGTAFQARVWQALRRIPLGHTRSYGELAQALGRPSAARAVAAACGANRVALLIPCHRVIAADGSMAGYRWGVTRKRRLLEREGSLCGGAAVGGQMAISTAGSRRL